jgi:hypothetical protein
LPERKARAGALFDSCAAKFIEAHAPKTLSLCPIEDAFHLHHFAFHRTPAGRARQARKNAKRKAKLIEGRAIILRLEVGLQ